MKIIDCFTFFNELDLLELRLNYLNDIVDLFIIVESNTTHSGQPKPFYFEDNIKSFEKFKSKIFYLKKNFDVSNMVFKKKTLEEVKYELKYGKKIDNFWKLEMEQREYINEGLRNVHENDIIIISDVDEIPEKESIIRYLNLNYKTPISLLQKNHYYYFNCVEKNEEWVGSVVSRKKSINSIQEMRNNRFQYEKFKNGGWHFSYLGGVDRIITKLKSFAHSEYNSEKFLNVQFLSEKINEGEDILDRGKKFIFFDIEHFSNFYPDYLLKNKEKFNKYIKPVKLNI